MPETEIDYQELSPALLTKNSLALSVYCPQLVEQFAGRKLNSKITLHRQNGFVNGKYLVNRNQELFFRKDPYLESARIFDDALRLTCPALLLGMGLGYGVDYLLQNSSIPKLYVYERDKSLLKVALTLHDFAAQILIGRLVIVPQEQIFTCIGPDIGKIIYHPVLFHEHKIEYLTISRLLASGKSGSRRAVIFSGQLFVLDIATTLFELGWDVCEVDATLLNASEANQLLQILAADLILQVNLFKDIELFCKDRVVVEWEIDPTISPIEEIKASAAGKLYVFTHNPDRVEEYRRKGYVNCDYLPLCTNERKFKVTDPSSASSPDLACQVSFVGSLMYDNQVRLTGILYDELGRRVENDTSWRAILNWVKQLLADPPAPTRSLHKITELQALLSSSGLSDTLTIGQDKLLISACIDEVLAFRWREHMVKSFLPLNIQIWGDPDWLTRFPQSYRGAADHYLELPKLYAAAKINLDICRIYQANIVTMRVFDVLAVGGFVLADRSEALLELFEEDHDIVCYETPEEALDKAHFYLENEEKRLTIAQRGQQKVLDSHTFRYRVRKILADIGIE
jgi:spore maturation protein CgeB